MLAMYTLGIVVAIIVGVYSETYALKAPPPPFMMELPPYRLPNLRTVFQNMFTRAWLFVKRAGTVILAISIILWALMYFPRSAGADDRSASSRRQLSQTATSHASNRSDRRKRTTEAQLRRAARTCDRTGHSAARF